MWPDASAKCGPMLAKLGATLADVAPNSVEAGRSTPEGFEFALSILDNLWDRQSARMVWHQLCGHIVATSFPDIADSRTSVPSIAPGTRRTADNNCRWASILACSTPFGAEHDAVGNSVMSTAKSSN